MAIDNGTHACARCGNLCASFRVGPPALQTVIWLCGVCFFNNEGADLRLRALQRINDDE